MAFKVGPVQDLMNSFTKQRFFGQQIFHTPEKNPFRKKQYVQATVILEPATFTKKAVVAVEKYRDDFMSVVAKVQKKYPGKEVSYQTLDLRPNWLKEEQERAKAALKRKAE